MYDAKRIAIAGGKVELKDLAHARVFVAAQNPEPVGACVRNHGMNLATELRRSSAVVVNNPANPPEEMLLHAVLAGGFLMDPAAIQGLGTTRSGACIKYHPALAVPRQIWVSQGMQDTHPEHWKLIQSAAGGACGVASSWILLATQEAFIDRWTQNHTRHRNHQAAALVTEAEHESDQASV